VRQGRDAEACAAWAAIIEEKTGTIQAQKALFDITIHTMETTGCISTRTISSRPTE